MASIVLLLRIGFLGVRFLVGTSFFRVFVFLLAPILLSCPGLLERLVLGFGCVFLRSRLCVVSYVWFFAVGFRLIFGFVLVSLGLVFGLVRFRFGLVGFVFLGFLRIFLWLDKIFAGETQCFKALGRDDVVPCRKSIV